MWRTMPHEEPRKHFMWTGMQSWKKPTVLPDGLEIIFA